MSASRERLTVEERAGMTEAYLDGDESMICGFAGDVYAYPFGTPANDGKPGSVAHPDGAVWLPELDEDQRCLSSDEARQLALALLEAADHVDFGPGEWGADWSWRRIEYPRAAR